MGHRTLLLVGALAGCRQIAGLDDPVKSDAAPPNIDAMIDTPASEFCVTTIYETICLSQAPTTPQAVSGTISTSGSPPCAGNVVSGAVNECVVAGTTISVASGVTATFNGTRPVVLIASGAVTIDGTLDAASHSGSFTGGPGSNFSGCNSGTSPSGGGGGQGGSFSAAGGNGGAPTGGSAGTALAAPTMLHGGCTGRSGSGGDGGSHGNGGGALYVYAGTTITVNASGIVNASGGGGQGADGTNSGGGGGGSGGMIVLDAQSVTIAGSVFANGGGGGGGGTTGQGQSGRDPTAASAGGGGGNGASGSDSGGTGGSGTTAATAGGDGATGTAGGGGGGGSVGVIKLHGTQNVTGSVSPPAS